MIKRGFIVGVLCVFAPITVSAQADDAATLYLRAAQIVVDHSAKQIDCPSSSSLSWPHGYPPFPDEWQSMEEAAFNANADARVLAHQASAKDSANWPEVAIPVNGSSYLNQCRALSNELADAANYQLTLKNYAAGLEQLRDLWHLADLLENAPNKKLIRLLVSIGIRAEVMDRLTTLVAYATLTNDPHHLRDIQVDVLRQQIAVLLNHADAKTQVMEFLKAEGATENSQTQKAIDNCIRTMQRVNAERDMGAISLACHVYQFEIGKWPSSLDDLHTILPKKPIDPWGDGKQTFGYVVIKEGLPDGGDRPLVYSRDSSKDGLFFRTGQAGYSYYVRDRSQQKPGGQFRDVAAWIVPDAVHLEPGIQMLK